MTGRFRVVALVVATAFAGACNCSSPPVKEGLKAEGIACAADAECQTGLCEALPGGDKLCMRKCTDGCLSNEICEPLAPDRYGCVPEVAGLCEACVSDADCPYPGDRCILVGGLSVCGRDCSFDGTCPESFTCGDAVGVDGALLNTQCQPKSGTCECTAESAGQTLPCEVSNSFGTCTGVKTCSATEGYSACNARTPSEESCNGIDDDCDGQIDEDLGETMCGVGACAVIVSNCANGVPQTCVPRMGSPEVCDEVDNDCDGQIDEDYDKANSIQNCGTCGNDCAQKLTAAQPHGTATCADGQCALVCDEGWDDCDRVFANGCETDVYTDASNCGGCFVRCSNINGAATCDQGVCSRTCDPGFANCDDDWANGCEIDTTSDVSHCGSCTNVCAAPNATAQCLNSACVYACATDWWDLDGDPANGCEYHCVFQSATDLPDLEFVDANCDGMDGEIANAIFVAPPASGGNDSNPGTRTQPKATISGGLNAAIAGGKRDVYVAAGTYLGQVNITAPGKGVYGGYQAGSWARSTSNGVTVTGVNMPLRIDGADNTTVQLMSFLGANATGASATAYGAFIRSAMGVNLIGLHIQAGHGTAGTNGAPGSTGQSGSGGSVGQSGCENSGGLCTSCSRPEGGAGGTSTCGRTGGKGGNAGHGSSAGMPGGQGAGGTPGGLGVPAGLGNASYPANSPYRGADGASGNPGSHGTSAGGMGQVQASGYVPALATAGGTGGHGNGGGGGGGGGGGTTACDSYGGGGGGGGAGGCGGTGGGPGTSGGASIGIYLYDATVNAEAVTVVAGNGGGGGSGGVGGPGGQGGPGGPHSQYGGGSEQDDGSNGAPGGSGGKGGNGGTGGGGGGGPSIGVVRGGLSTWNAVGSTTITTGLPGIGGAGGSSPGSVGLVQQIWP